MNNLKKIVLGALFLCIGISVAAQSEKDTEIIKDAETAKQTLIHDCPDLKNYFNKAAGYVIFPNTGQGAFIVGAASGNGVLYKKGGKVLGMASLKKLNLGFQAGGEAFIEVIFFETKKELNKFKKGTFEFDAFASATLVDRGKSFNGKFAKGVAVFTKTKGGLIAQISVGTQKFKFRKF
ncbi:lipid-binding SYLF domain-containing protein [Formosa haliotis]|uniref:lipid-binding SYLF domain-containing protein n=1 Tax=Formosa haliotis TaxID=1555194 RepID=UPI000824E2A1|nr:lipid-binding SYLF domain-containing protein [Formosa haliotis]